eukprot:801405-Prymnesium_polylepis.1
MPGGGAVGAGWCVRFESRAPARGGAPRWVRRSAGVDPGPVLYVTRPYEMRCGGCSLMMGPRRLCEHAKQ